MVDHFFYKVVFYEKKNVLIVNSVIFNCIRKVDLPTIMTLCWVAHYLVFVHKLQIISFDLQSREFCEVWWNFKSPINVSAKFYALLWNSNVLEDIHFFHSFSNFASCLYAGVIKFLFRTLALGINGTKLGIHTVH